MHITVVIVNFNAGNHLKDCLLSIARQHRPPDRCLIIDNHSLVHPLKGTEAWLRGAELVSLKENVGFAAANNLAVTLCPEADWIALLNPDAYPEPDWLFHLEEATRRHPQDVVFACRQLSTRMKNCLDGAGDGLTRAGRPFRRGFGRPDEASYLESDQVFSSCGAATFIKRSVFEALGGFDEDFFCYLEDVDLGFRLRLQGYGCRYLPQAKVHHEGSALSGHQSDFATYHGHRNLEWVFFKNMPLPLLFLYLPQHLLLMIISFIICLRRGQGRIILLAKWHALKGARKNLLKRSRIQHQRKASIVDLWQALTPERGRWRQ